MIWCSMLKIIPPSPPPPPPPHHHHHHHTSTHSQEYNSSTLPKPKPRKKLGRRTSVSNAELQLNSLESNLTVRAAQPWMYSIVCAEKLQAAISLIARLHPISGWSLVGGSLAASPSPPGRDNWPGREGLVARLGWRVCRSEQNVRS